MPEEHQLSPVIPYIQRMLIIAKSEESCFTSHQSDVTCESDNELKARKKVLLSSTCCVQPVLVLLVI